MASTVKLHELEMPRGVPLKGASELLFNCNVNKVFSKQNLPRNDSVSSQ